MRLGSKSGLLPRPKKIFKQPYKHEIYTKPQDTGYAENILHPKNISREYQPPKVVTPEQRLARTAKEPAKKYSEEELALLPQAQQDKIRAAKLRRDYLKQSYDTEVKRLAKQEAFQQQRDLEHEQEKAAKTEHTQSDAEIFTVPTIESYLNGPLIRQRTPEETAELQLRKEANRLQTKLDVDTRRAQSLLELYNASAKFAINEEQVERLVNEAFSTVAADSQKELYAKSAWSEISPAAFDDKLMDTILDQVNNGPGFNQVQDQLTGFNNDIKELADQIQTERNEKKMNSAKEKASQFEDLKSQLQN